MTELLLSVHTYVPHTRALAHTRVGQFRGDKNNRDPSLCCKKHYT